MMYYFKNVFAGIVCLLIAWNNAYAIQIMGNSIDSEMINATHQAPMYYEANQLLDIETSIELPYTLTALGMNVFLPTGWDFMGTSGANPSDISPKETGNIVSFAWMNHLTPQVLTFSYHVRPVAIEDDLQRIAATIFFRVGSSEEMTQTVSPNPLIIRADIDSDGDGIKNSQDAFPDDKTEWIDTDGDLEGNNADPDDDNDNMPDVWEIENHLDPLIDDANEDLDDDGFTNIQEYENQTLPYNYHPQIPDLLFPAINSNEVSLSPVLVTSDFIDNNPGDTLSGAEWEISTNIHFQNPVFSVYTDSDQVKLLLPDFILDSNTVYYWRVRHYDQHEESSDWSVSHFTTITQTDFVDGIPIAQKVDDTVDLDEDGIPDNQQSSIKSLASVVGNVNVGIKSDSPDNYTISMAQTIDPSLVITDTVNRPAQLPFGMIAFKVNVDDPGDSAKIKVHYSEPLPDNAIWYMYDVINGWDSYIPQLSNDRKIVTIYLTDGGDCDSDGKRNGVIIDPSGPGIPKTSDTQDSSDTIQLNEDIDNGSCFLQTIQSHSQIIKFWVDK